MKIITKTLCSILCMAIPFISTYAQEDPGEAVLSYGLGFLDVPYVPHTLDGEVKEDLVVNCDEMDCTTFVEYTLAMALSPTEDGQVAEGDFANNVQRIRYRDGRIDGYASRLHYITDWAENGIRNGFLEDITEKKSPYTQKVTVNYMSTHPEQYWKLADSPEDMRKIKKIENELSKKEIHYIPEDKLPVNGLPWIKNGDIIAITTNISGLDIAHMGIAFYVDGKLGLLHASSTEKKVTVSRIALSQMLKNNDKWTGIRVLRLKK